MPSQPGGSGAFIETAQLRSAILVKKLSLLNLKLEEATSAFANQKLEKDVTTAMHEEVKRTTVWKEILSGKGSYLCNILWSVSSLLPRLPFLCLGGSRAVKV
jgi:hypothetical protein